MNAPNLVALPVRREYERLACHIIADTLREMASDLDTRYRSTLDSFARGLAGQPYPGSSRPSGIDPAHVVALEAASRRLAAARQSVETLAGMLRGIARDVNAPRRRTVGRRHVA